MRWCVQGKKAYKAVRARKDMNIASRQHFQLMQQVCLSHDTLLQSVHVLSIASHWLCSLNITAGPMYIAILLDPCC